MEKTIAQETTPQNKVATLFTPQHVKHLPSISMDKLLKKDSIGYNSPSIQELFTVYLNLKDQLLDYEHYNGLESTITPYEDGSHCRYYIEWNNTGDIDNNGLDDYIATMQFGVLHGEISDQQCKKGAPPLSTKDYYVHGMHVRWNILFLRFQDQAYPIFVLSKDVEFGHGGLKTIYKGPFQFCHGPKFFIYDKNLLDDDSDVWKDDPITKIMYFENNTIKRMQLNADAIFNHNNNLKCIDIVSSQK